MLQQVDGEWKFTSEAALEQCLWENLERCVGYRPIAQQLRVLGEYCDIVAVDAEGTPIIIELKNAEDRYVVQQLTRYYDNLINSSLELLGVDLSRRPKLIAVAPTFHRHNFIDRKYSTLPIQFVELLIEEEDNQFFLKLIDVDKRIFIGAYIELYQVSAIQRKKSLYDRFSPQLRKLLLTQSDSYADWIISVRNQTLELHESMGEAVTSSTITFGQKRGKKTLCTSEKRLCIRIEKLTQPDKFRIFAYLPATVKSSLRIVKIEIVFNDVNSNVEAVILPGKCRSTGKFLDRSLERNGYLPVQNYLNLYFRDSGSEEQDISISDFLRLAQQDSLKRLDKS